MFNTLDQETEREVNQLRKTLEKQGVAGTIIAEKVALHRDLKLKRDSGNVVKTQFVEIQDPQKSPWTLGSFLNNEREIICSGQRIGSMRFDLVEGVVDRHNAGLKKRGAP